MFEHKSLLFWQLAIWGYESKPACGSKSRWFETTVPGVSEDVVLSCALLKFPTQQWDVQNWQDILMIFVETEISYDFSSCRSYTKNGTLVHHWTFPRGLSPSPLPKPTSNLAAPSSWWFLPCWGCISVQTIIFQTRWKCLMGQTRVQKASRSRWFSFLLGVLHVFGLSLAVYLEQEERKTTKCTGQPKEKKRKTNKTRRQQKWNNQQKQNK